MKTPAALRLVIGLILLVGPWTVLGGPAAAEARPGHAPILIEGDADLCDDEDRDGRVGTDDGIVNCDTADGSPTNPYRVEGWHVAVTSGVVCPLAGPVPVLVPDCSVPTACEEAQFEAAVSVCGTSRHLVLEDLEVEVTTSASGVAGITLEGASHVLVRNSTVTVPGVAVHVAGLADPEVEARPAADIRLDGLHVASFFLDAAHQEVPSLSHALVEIRNADVAIERTVVDASHRSVGLIVDAEEDLESGRVHAFYLNDSVVQDARLQGADIRNVHAELHRNQFLENGQAGTSWYVEVQVADKYSSTTLDDLGALFLSTANLGSVVVGNHFDVHGTGLAMRGNATGRIEANRFVGRVPTDIALIQEEACASRVRFNDFERLRVANGAFTCALDASRNWWGQAEGPAKLPAQTEGRVQAAPWLQLPRDQLPTLEIRAPASGDRVHGALVVEGAAASRTQDAIVRVEASRLEEDWSESVKAHGNETWRLDWPADAEPRGPLLLWLRACTQRECGIPASLALEVIDPPLPPIAVLEGAPRQIRPGEAVALDASRSYSPQGRPLVAYRFHLGDSRTHGWTDGPFLAATYPRTGLFAAFVEVRDAERLQSTNPAEVVIRVAGPRGEEGTVQELLRPATDLPAPPPAWVLAALASVGAVAAWGRRP